MHGQGNMYRSTANNEAGSVNTIPQVTSPLTHVFSEGAKMVNSPNLREPIEIRVGVCIYAKD